MWVWKAGCWTRRTRVQKLCHAHYTNLLESSKVAGTSMLGRSALRSLGIARLATHLSSCL